MATRAGGTATLRLRALVAFATWALVAWACSRQPPSAGREPATPPASRQLLLRVQVLAEAIAESRVPAPASCVLPDCVLRSALSPVGGAEVHWVGWGAGPLRMLRTEATGRVALRVPLDGAALEVRAAGFVPRRIELGPTGVADEELEVVLQPFRSRTVFVVAGGRPLEAAQVEVELSDGSRAAGRTDRAGRLHFRHLEAPATRVRASAPGYEPEQLQGAAGLGPGPWKIALEALGRLEIAVVGLRGLPSSGATVRLRHDASAAPRSVRTDALGRVRLSGLPLGFYDLRAENSNAVSPVRLGVLASGSKPTKVVLRLVPASHLEVRIVAAGEREAPVERAELRLVEGALGSFALVARSDAEGRATLGPFLRSGAQLSVRAAGFVPRLAEPVPSDETEPWVLSLLRGGRVAGTVVGPDGEPVPGARFEVLGDDLFGRPLSLSSPAQQGGMGWERAPAPDNLGVVPLPAREGFGPSGGRPFRSDAGGRFEFAGLPPGRLRLRVHHRDFLERVGEAFTLQPGGSVERRVQLQLGFRLRGRVVDGSGVPAVGARVEARGARLSGSRLVRTDSAGGFALRALPGSVQLLVASPEDPSRVVLRRDVRLESSDETLEQEVLLRLPEGRESARVCVLDADDQPVSGVRVVLSSLELQTPFRELAFSGRDGCLRVEASGLRLLLELSAPGLRPRSLEWLADTEGLALRLEPGWELRGRVTHVRGRQPLAGALVSVLQNGRRYTAVADAHGEYRLTDVGSAPFELRASHSDCEPSSLPLWPDELPQEGFSLFAPPLDLEPAATLQGRVEWPDGRPAPGARVGLSPNPPLRPLHGEAPGWTTSDARGRFRLGQLRLGEVDLYAVAPGRGWGALYGHPVNPARSSAEVVLVLTGAPSEDSESPAEPNLAVEIERAGSGLELSYIAPGSEAERAGLVAGQKLLRIEGRAFQEVKEARRALSGPEGSRVLLDLSDEAASWRVSVRRESVKR